jgi:DNA-binding MarR family transcriptional regulator
MSKMPNVLLLSCYAATCRQAARAISQHYSEALRPAGIEGTHFTLTMLLRTLPGLTSSEIGAHMVMDKTTLTRTLRLMEAALLVRWEPGKDRREKHWNLTEHGETIYQQAYPLWQQAQALMRRRLGDDALSTWQGLTHQVAVALADPELPSSAEIIR